MKNNKKLTFTFFLSLCMFYQVNAQTSGIIREVMQDLLSSICPDDKEIETLIKDSKIQYDPSLVNTTPINSDNEELNAWHLGAYSTGLVYSYVFDKKEEAKNYTNHLEKISKKLGYENALVFSKLRQHLSNGNNYNISPIISIGKDAMMEINDKLQEKKRFLSLLIITGAWVESLYIHISALKKTPTERLKNKIAEQGIISEQLALLLSFHDDNPSANNMILTLQKLDEVYKEMDIKITYLEPVEKYNDEGILVYEDNTKIEANYSTETLDKLYEVVKGIRNSQLK